MDRNATEEGISSLLDELLVHILSFLDLKNAIRTSTLSRRWRHLWTLNPNLNFDLGPELGDKCIWIIYRTVLFYKRTDMNRFRINAKLNEDMSNELETWIRFATTRKVRELFIKSDADDEIPLPQFLYSHTSLTVLDLAAYFLFDLPVGFKGFPCLKTYDLCCVRITDKAVTTLLSTCPLLEKLSFAMCHDLVNLNISAPNNILKILEFDHCPNLEKLDVDAPHLVSFQFLAFQGPSTTIYLKNASSLREGEPNFSLQQKESNPEEVHEHAPLVRCMAHIDSLEVHEYFMFKSPHIMFMNLKEFSWSGHLDSRYLILALASFLGDCPSLQKLTIGCFPKKISLSYSNWHKRYYGLLDDSAPPLEGAVLRHLKTIELVNLSGTKKEMDLVRYLPSKAIVLDSLIGTFWSNKKTKSLKVLKKISVMDKTSPHVK